MGSSLARYGIIPSLISKNNGLEPDSVCNVGIDAGTPFEMYVTYKKQLNILSNATIVYYTIEPWIFSSKYYRYKKYEKIRLNYKQWRLLYKDQGLFNDYLFPIHIFIDSLEFKKSLSTPWNEYLLLPGHRHFQPLKELLFEYEPYTDFPVSLFQLYYLRKLKDAVEQNGGTFICVLVPKHRTWCRSYYRDCSRFNYDFVSLFNRYVGAVRIVGSNCDEAYKLKDADFFDSFHLNNVGAYRFTEAEFSDISRHLRQKPAFLQYFPASVLLDIKKVKNRGEK
jgi:hypothetical protein